MTRSRQLTYAGPDMSKRGRMALMAAKITDDLKAFIEANRPSLVATSSKTGEPNVSPKMSLRVLDDEHLVFADVMSPKTRQNVQENPRVCVLLLSVQERRGYQFKGSAEYIANGPLYEQVAAGLKKAMPALPPPVGVVRIHVEDIFEVRGMA